MAALKPGMRLRSAGCSTEVMVIQAPEGECELTCAGAPMLPHGAPSAAATPAPAGAPGVLLGKRYVDASGRLELLCTRAGSGPLALAGEPLVIKAPKPLPSSD